MCLGVEKLAFFFFLGHKRGRKGSFPLTLTSQSPVNSRFFSTQTVLFFQKNLEKQSEITLVFHFSLCLRSVSCSLERTNRLFLYRGTEVKCDLRQNPLRTKMVESDPVFAWPLHTSGSICAARAGPSDPITDDYSHITWSIDQSHLTRHCFSLFFSSGQ